MRAKKAMNIKKEEIASLPITRPMECLQIDHTGVLPLSENGNRYILMIIDCSTKIVKLYPVRTMESKEVINCLLNLFATFGVARMIVSDKKLPCIPELTEKMTSMFKVKRILTGSHRHLEAGLIESVNKRTKLAFQTSLAESNKWNTIIPIIEMSRRSTPNKATGTSPHEMLFGFRHQNSIDWELSRGVLKDEGADTRLKEIAHGLEFLKTAVKENTETSRNEAQKECSRETIERDDTTNRYPIRQKNTEAYGSSQCSRSVERCDKDLGTSRQRLQGRNEKRNRKDRQTGNGSSCFEVGV